MPQHAAPAEDAEDAMPSTAEASEASNALEALEAVATAEGPAEEVLVVAADGSNLINRVLAY